MEKGQMMPAGDQQVGPTVVVIVCYRRTVREKVDLIQAHLGRDILEAKIAEVAIEAAGIALDLVFVRPFVMAAAGNEQIEQAVAVEVDHGQAAAQRFQNGVMVGLLAIAISEVDAAFGRHLAEQPWALGLFGVAEHIRGDYFLVGSAILAEVEQSTRRDDDGWHRPEEHLRDSPGRPRQIRTAGHGWDLLMSKMRR